MNIKVDRLFEVKRYLILKRMVGMVLLLMASINGFAQQKDLLLQLQAIASVHPATIGFAFLDLQNGKTFTINGNRHMPMQSVFKFHIALAILNQVDQGKLSLDQKILIKKSDLLSDTWSPLRDKYPNGGVEIPLSELLTYMIELSDNNGCDILFRLIGGPAQVNAYIHSIGIKKVNIAATEEGMHHDEKAQYSNWTTPVAACQLLNLFYQNKFLSKKSHDFLWMIMTETTRGSDKIKGWLPAHTPVAHKTGYSGTNEAGFTAASNDIGVVTLPDGKHFAVAVFVTDTKEDNKVINSTIAELTKACWDYYNTDK